MLAKNEPFLYFGDTQRHPDAPKNQKTKGNR